MTAGFLRNQKQHGDEKASPDITAHSTAPVKRLSRGSVLATQVYCEHPLPDAPVRPVSKASGKGDHWCLIKTLGVKHGQ